MIFGILSPVAFFTHPLIASTEPEIEVQSPDFGVENVLLSVKRSLERESVSYQIEFAMRSRWIVESAEKGDQGLIAGRFLPARSSKPECRSHGIPVVPAAPCAVIPRHGRAEWGTKTLSPPGCG